MSNHEPPIPHVPAGSGSTQPGPAGDSGEYERLAHALDVRFTPHVQAAAALVRSAEQDLAHAREQVGRARERAANERYRSDPLVFMRASVKDEVEALDRKTTEKKVRAAYKYLVDRALELAAGEVQGFTADQVAAQQERREGVAACEQAERHALATLQAAQEMHDRVREAQRRANDGLALMMQKLGADSAEG